MSFRNRPSEDCDAYRRDGTNDVVPASGRFANGISTISGTLLMVIVMGAGSTGLTFVATHLARQDQPAASDDEPGGGIIVRSEVVRLFLPRTLIELANRPTQQTPLRTHDDLRRRLEIEHHRDLWYALTVRGLQVNGESVDLTFIRRPYDEPDRFPEFLEVLAAAVGNPPCKLVRAAVHLIPDELSVREPREVISELFDQPQVTQAGCLPHRGTAKTSTGSSPAGPASIDSASARNAASSFEYCSLGAF